MAALPMRVEREGDAAAWLAGTLVAPRVQGVMALLESFFEPLVAGHQKASLYLCPFRRSEGPLAWGPSLLLSGSGT